MNKISTVFFLCLFIQFFAQAQTVETDYQGCNSFTAYFTGSIDQGLANYNFVTRKCQGIDNPIVNAYVKGAQFQLQKKNANGTYSTINTAETNDADRTYSSLSTGIYRVIVFRRNSVSFFDPTYTLYSTTNSCQIAAYRYDGNFNAFYSQDIEIGYPTTSLLISPTPTGNPAKICYSLVDAANEPINVNASSSFGERGYFIAVFKNNAAGVEVAYASTGWVTGKAGIFNLKTLNMAFEPGYSYTVQLALTQLPCTGWVDAYSTFKIDGNCRDIEENANIRVYPNPASDQLNIEGLEGWQASDLSVNITDMLGRNVLSTTLSAPFEALNLTGIQAGNYVLTLNSGEKFFSQKLIIQ